MGRISKRLSRWLPALAEAYREARGGGLGTIAAGQHATLLSRTELETAGATLLRLQRGLTGGRRLAGAAYMDDPDLLGAYLLYYWPVSYVQVSLALAELGIQPRRVLDLGSGPGPAASAALDSGAEELILADASARALGLARALLGRADGRIVTARTDLESAGALAGLRGPFDLVIVGHAANELWPGAEDRLERRLGLLERAAALLAPGGALLVLEPALLATSREALALRDALSGAGFLVLGPCPASASGHYPCPALAAGPDRTCHSEAAWEPPEPVAFLARAAGLDRRSVKYAWFAVSSAAPRAIPDAERDAAGAANPPPTAKEGTDDSISHNVSMGRVVSDPMLNKAGRVRYFVCAGGRLVSLSARKDAPEARDSGFLDLRRGDTVRVSGAEERPGGGVGVVPGTRLELVRRAPRP